MDQIKTSFLNPDEVLKNRQAQSEETPIRYEFQYYGNYLAEKLEDPQHATLYMKLAKETDRALLEQALDFVRGVVKVKNRARLFMWKLGELKKQ